MNVLPPIAVYPLLEFLQAKHFKSIWCPFDTNKSSFVQILKENGFKVIHSHLLDNKDFFTFEPDDYDCIISNPPFSIKDLVLQRAILLGKPFALLLPLPCLQGVKRFDLFSQFSLQLLVFDKRIVFSSDLRKYSSNCFASIYFCKNLLPQSLCFKKL